MTRPGVTMISCPHRLGCNHGGLEVGCEGAASHSRFEIAQQDLSSTIYIPVVNSASCAGAAALLACLPENVLAAVCCSLTLGFRGIWQCG